MYMESVIADYVVAYLENPGELNSHLISLPV